MLLAHSPQLLALRFDASCARWARSFMGTVSC